jgi:hypothetical protein
MMPNVILQFDQIIGSANHPEAEATIVFDQW